MRGASVCCVRQGWLDGQGCLRTRTSILNRLVGDWLLEAGVQYSSNKDINKLVRQKVREGWFWEKGRKHGKLHSPDGDGYIAVPGSPSDYRAPRNFERELTRLAG